MAWQRGLAGHHTRRRPRKPLAGTYQQFLRAGSRIAGGVDGRPSGMLCWLGTRRALGRREKGGADGVIYGVGG